MPAIRLASVAGVAAGALVVLGLISTFWSMSRPAPDFRWSLQQAAEQLHITPDD